MSVESGKNKLYYGDNYDVLRRYLRDESVDLIYLDPPFNSRQDYNVLFAEKDGSKSSSQIHAFEDTWEWNLDAERSYQHIVERISGQVADAMRAFRTFLGTSDMMAYLAMMAPRLVDLRRVLKQTSSFYLTASLLPVIASSRSYGGVYSLHLHFVNTMVAGSACTPLSLIPLMKRTHVGLNRNRLLSADRAERMLAIACLEDIAEGRKWSLQSIFLA